MVFSDAGLNLVAQGRGVEALLLSRARRNISRKRAKKERHPFDVDVYIEKVSEVPDNIEAAVVALVRAPRAERTNLASNSGGVCMWDQVRLAVTEIDVPAQYGTWNTALRAFACWALLHPMPYADIADDNNAIQK